MHHYGALPYGYCALLAGQHGTPYKQAGHKLIEEANQVKGELGQILKDVGNQLLERGRDINHY